MEYFVNKLAEFVDKHPEKFFVAKVLLVALVVVTLKAVFPHYWFGMLIGFGLFPLVTLQAITLITDKTLKEVIRQNLTIISVPYSENERIKQIPIVTYSLIAINFFVYFCIQPYLSESTHNQLVYVPYDPNWISVPIATITSCFLHGSNSHLFGNMLFLWAFGTSIERRVESKQYIVFYLVFGFFASIIPSVIDLIFRDHFTHSLGASGAIAGLMGLYAVRCYYKTMVFPFPLFGLFSYLMPVSAFIKLRVNALYVVALFFFKDLHYGTLDLMGFNYDNVGYWAHIGGFLTAVIMGFAFKLHHQALEEKDIDLAYDSIKVSEIGTEEGEAALRRHIARNQNDSEAWLTLSRMITKYELDEEGINAYLTAIRLKFKESQTEAAEIFREYYHKHFTPLPDNNLMYWIAAAFAKSKDFEQAARVLELVIENEENLSALKEKAIKQLIKLYKILGHDHAIERYEVMLN